MKKNKRNNGLGWKGALLLLVAVGIGYATLSTTLNVKGDISTPIPNLDVRMENPKEISTIKSNNELEITDNTSLSFEVVLSQLTDVYEFTVDVKNYGKTDAVLWDANFTVSPDINVNLGVGGVSGEYYHHVSTYTSIANVYDVYFRYEDDSYPQVTDILSPGESKTLKVTVKFNDYVDLNSLSDDVDYSVDFDLLYINPPKIVKSLGEVKPADSNNAFVQNSTFTVGDQRFYVVNREGNTVTAVAYNNLYLGYNYTDMNTESAKIAEISDKEYFYGIQSTNAIGKEYDRLNKEYTGRSFATVAKLEYASASKQYYDATFRYLDTYKHYLNTNTSGYTFDVSLISKADYEKYGLQYFVANTWLSDNAEGNQSYAVDFFGTLVTDMGTNDSSFGIRPIVTFQV